jgi:hypothetical protein
MSATKEDIQRENELYDRLTSTVTEALLTLPYQRSKAVELSSHSFQASRQDHFRRARERERSTADKPVLPLSLALSHRGTAPRAYRQEGLRAE